MKTVSIKQQVIHFVRDYMESYIDPPTNKEVQDAFPDSSKKALKGYRLAAIYLQTEYLRGYLNWVEATLERQGTISKYREAKSYYKGLVHSAFGWLFVFIVMSAALLYSIYR